MLHVGTEQTCERDSGVWSKRSEPADSRFRASDRGSAMRRASPPGSSLVRLAATQCRDDIWRQLISPAPGDHRVGRSKGRMGCKVRDAGFGAQQRNSDQVRRQRLAAMEIGGGGGFAPSTTGLTWLYRWMDGLMGRPLPLRKDGK